MSCYHQRQILKTDTVVENKIFSTIKYCTFKASILILFNNLKERQSQLMANVTNNDKTLIYIHFIQ